MKIKNIPQFPVLDLVRGGNTTQTNFAEAKKPKFTPVKARKPSISDVLKEIPGTILHALAKPKESQFRMPYAKESIPIDVPPALTVAGDFGARALELPVRALVTLSTELINAFRPTKAVEEFKLPFSAKRLGYESDKVTTAYKEMATATDAGENPLIAGLRIASKKTLDAAIGADLVKGFAEAFAAQLEKGLPDFEAWNVLNRPSTMAEAESNYKTLAKQLHPDKPYGSQEAFSVVTDAMQKIRESGIPTASKIRVGIARRLEQLGRETENIKDIFGLDLKPKAYDGRSVILEPQRALPGARPVNPESRPVGLSTEPVEPVGKGQKPATPENVNKSIDRRLTEAVDQKKALVVDPDSFKKEFGDYASENHPVYSDAANRLYERALEKMGGDTVKFTAGGPASGKSDFLVDPISNNFKGIIVDGTFRTYEGALYKINKALDAGKDVEIYGIIPTPEIAWKFAQIRAQETGRSIPLDFFVDAHVGSINTLRQLVEDGANVFAIDTRGITDARQARQQPLLSGDELLAKLKEISYDKNELKQKLQNVNVNTTAKEPTPPTLTSSEEEGYGISSQTEQEPTVQSSASPLSKKGGPDQVSAPSQEILEFPTQKTTTGAQTRRVIIQQTGPASRTSEMITKRESTLLKDRIRNIARGVREGRINTKREVGAVQSKLLQMIDDSDLELGDKAKFRKTVKNIQTVEQLKKSLPTIQQRITNLEEASLKRGIGSQIDKELKRTKPVKKGTRKVEKYDYTTSKTFKELRELNNINQDDALAKLATLSPDGLSEQEKIISRFLSYKANGSKGSVTLHEQVLADINLLKELGSQAKDEADFKKLLERQEMVDEVLTGIEHQKPSKKFLSALKSGYVSSVANLYSSINAVAGKAVADRFDYGMFQTDSDYSFSRRVDLATEKAKEIYNTKSNKGLTKHFINDMAPLNYTLNRNDFSDEISKFEIMDIYNGLKNPLRRQQYYNAFGEDQINALTQNLTPEDIKVADYLMEEVQSYSDILNQRNIEMFGTDMGTVKHYWPSKSEHYQDFFDDIRRQGEIPSALRERSKNANVVPQPQNIWLNFQRHIAQAEHIKNLSPLYEELKRTFSDARVEKTIRKKYGDKAYEALIDNIETFSLNNVSKKLDIFSGGYNTALNNWVKAKIASPTVFARQMISSVYSIEQVGIKDFIKYQTDFFSNPGKNFKWMWENVPFLQTRFQQGYSEALQDVIRGTKKLQIGTGGITKYASLPTRSGDILAIVLNGYPILKSELDSGKTMEEAIATLQKFTEKTQQSGSPANLSSLQRQRNAFARTFLRFKNTLNQLLRLQVDANIQYINKQITGEEYAKKTFLYSVYTPLMYVLMGLAVTQGYKAVFGKADRKKISSLPGDILQQVIIQPFQTIPLLDATAEAAYSEIRKRITGQDYYLGEGLFSYPLLDDVSTAWSKLTKKEPSAYDFLRVFSLLQEPATGLPTETALRYVRYATGGGGSTGKSGSTPALFGDETGPQLPSIPQIPQIPKLPELNVR